MDSKRLLHLLTQTALSAFVILALAGTAQAQSTWYVSTGGSDSYNGTSPDFTGGLNGAKKTIDGALNVASDGDIIVINAGTYAETVDPSQAAYDAGGTGNPAGLQNLTFRVTVDGISTATVTGLIISDNTSISGGTGALATGALTLTDGTLTVGSNQFTLSSGGTITRTEGAFSGTPTLPSSYSVVYNAPALAGSAAQAITAGTELATSIGSGTLTINQGDGTLSLPSALSARTIVVSGTNAAAVSAAGLTLNGSTFNTTSLTVSGGSLTAASLAMGNQNVQVVGGTLTVSGATTATTSASSTTNSSRTAAFNVDGGTLALGAITLSSVAQTAASADFVVGIDVEAGATAKLNGAITESTAASSSTDGSTHRGLFVIDNAGTTEVNAAVATNGDVNNTGAIKINSGGSLGLGASSFTALGAFTGGSSAGALTISGAGGSAAAVTTDGSITVSGNGNFGDVTAAYGGITFSGSNTSSKTVGNLTATRGSVSISGRYSGGTLNAPLGSVTAAIAGTATQAFSSVDSKGDFTASGPVNFAELDLDANATIGGTTTFGSGTNSVIDGSLTVSGTTTYNGAGTLTTSGGITNNGTLSLGGGGTTSGSITTAASGTLNVNANLNVSGSLSGGKIDYTMGTPTITVTAQSATGATIAPGPNSKAYSLVIAGDSDRTVTLTGNFQLDGNLQVKDDTFFDLTNKLLTMTLPTANVDVESDGQITGQANTGSILFQPTSAGSPTVTNSGTLPAIAPLIANISVNNTGGGDVMVNNAIRVNTINLIDDGVTIAAGMSITFTSGGAVTINTANTDTQITAAAGSLLGAYDVNYTGASAGYTAGSEISGNTDNVTISTSGAGTVTLPAGAAIDGNLTVSGPGVLAGTFTVPGNVTVSGSLTGGTLTASGSGGVHSVTGFIDSSVVFTGASATVSGSTGVHATNRIAEFGGAVTVGDGTDTALTMTDIQEFGSTLTVLNKASLTVGLVDADPTGTDNDGVFDGAVAVNDGGSLTLTSSARSDAGVTVGNGTSSSVVGSLDLGGNTLTMNNVTLTANDNVATTPANASLGSTGLLRLDGGADAVLNGASVPNLHVDDPGTTIDGGTVAGDLEMEASVAVTGTLSLAGNATFDSGVAFTSGTVALTGSASTLTAQGAFGFNNLTVNSAGTVTFASNSGTSSRTFEVNGSYYHKLGVIALGFNDLSLDGAGFEFDGGSYTATSGDVIFNNAAISVSDGSGTASTTMSVPNATIAANTDVAAGDGLTVTGTLTISGGMLSWQHGAGTADDGVVTIGDGATIARSATGSLEAVPVFAGAVNVTYGTSAADWGDGGSNTTDRLYEMPSTVSTLTVNDELTLWDAGSTGSKSVTVTNLVLNDVLVIDQDDDNSNSVTVADAGSVSVGAAGAVSATGYTGTTQDLVYAGAYSLTYTGSSTTDGRIWQGSPSTVSVDDGSSTSGGITALLHASRTAGNVAFGAQDKLDLNGKTLTVTGTVSGSGLTGTGALALAGTGAQTLTGPITIPSLTVDNAAGVTLTGGNLTLSSGLTLTEGILDTGSNVVIIPHSSTSAQGFTRTNGFVKGTVRKTIVNGAAMTAADRMVFPVGINPYRPLAITFNNPSQISGTITLDVSHVGTAAGGNNNMPLTTVDNAGDPLTIARYPDFHWTVIASSTLSPSVSYDIELDAGGYAAFSGENIENTRTIRRQGGAATNFWTLVGGGVPSNNDNFAVSSTNPVTVVRNAVGALNASPGTLFTMGLESNFAAGAIAAQSVNAGATVDVDLSTVFAGGTSPFAYTVASSDGAIATGAVSGSTLTITGVSAGSATLTISATDALNDTSVATAAVTVNAALSASPANTAVALNAGATATFDLSTMFTGGAAPVTYAVTTADAAVATGAESSGTLTITAVANGSAIVTVTATDATSATASATFTTTVNAALAAAGTLADISVDQGATSDVDASGEFSGGDGTYTYTASAGAADVTVAVAGSTVSVTGVNPYTGTGDDAVDTAPVTVTVTATDGLGSSVGSTFAADVQPVKGNVAGLGGADPASASLTLDAFLSLASLTVKQAAAADYNGDSSVTPFDAAQIFDAWLNPAAAAKVQMVANPSSDMGFGEVDRVTNTVAIPVVVTGDVASAVAFSFETAIDPSVATVAGITTAEGWTIRYVTEEDGTVRIAGFGLDALPSGGLIATINLDLKDVGAAFTLKAQGAVNNNPATEIEGVEVVELPDNFALLGNYPNPFNPSTNISFDLPASADVAIEVYDMLGRRVMVLPAQTIQAGSRRSVQLNASQLASGSYFYRVIATMESKTQVDQGRMLLVK